MEIILDDKEATIYRFQCECLNPGCAIDICLDKDIPRQNRFIAIEFWSTPVEFRDKIKWCWKMMRWGMGYEHDFVVRTEDIEDLTKIIKG